MIQLSIEFCRDTSTLALKMFTVLFIGALSLCVTNSLKTCSNCIEITQCDTAMQLVTQNKNTQTLSLLKNLLCSTERIPKICCSDLMNIKQEDDIKTHPNINLLPNDCGYVKSNRLLGGYAASLNEFPWLVLIAHKVNNGFYFKCTGTLINSKYVLTAAHCIKGQRIVGVRVGAQDTSRTYECGKNGCDLHYEDIAVEEAIYHEGYINFTTELNDIGLLRLRKPANFSNDNAAAICLPLTKELQETNTDDEFGTIAGWGSLNNVYPNYSQSKLGVTIYPKSRCSSYSKRYSKVNPDEKFKNKLCGRRENNFLCDDVSGIPLLLEKEYNSKYRYVQFGVMIDDTGCDALTPVIFTDVRKYTNWILDTMKP